ncbi:MAG: CPBP family intramembrane metalloprotease [Nitrospirae bacterium]|nr:CPBP family intramembrane metalloprotease [Nitrospirota bacterium]
MIKALSIRAEFILVTVFSFGYFSLSSIIYFIMPRNTAPITQNHLASLTVVEVVMLALVLWFLKERGWEFADFKIRPSVRATASGILLALFAYGSYVMLCLVLNSISPEYLQSISQTPLTSSEISFAHIMAVSIINPLYEELLVVGYVIGTLKRMKNITYAVNVSVAIRLLYHLYQGPLGIMAIIPTGLIFGYWYAKRETLWPVIVAHAFIDFSGLAVAQWVK